MASFTLLAATRFAPSICKPAHSLWTTPRDMLAAGQQIAGFGVFGDGEYLLPTTGNQIIQISLGRWRGDRSARDSLSARQSGGGRR